ncbi:hypothetical protein ACQKWADRAFT_299300 [Trichoderma austrokoningii]
MMETAGLPLLPALFYGTLSFACYITLICYQLQREGHFLVRCAHTAPTTRSCTRSAFAGAGAGAGVSVLDRRIQTRLWRSSSMMKAYIDINLASRRASQLISANKSTSS